MMFRVSPSSGVPLYLQLMDQVKHAIDTGALASGDRLPTIRAVAEDLVINPNTVVRAYRELHHEGIIELKHGSGAFVTDSMTGRTKLTRKAQGIVQSALARLAELGLTEDEMRRLFENEVAQLRATGPSGGRRG
jgi:GntR family transcriptional regulator